MFEINGQEIDLIDDSKKTEFTRKLERIWQSAKEGASEPELIAMFKDWLKYLISVKKFPKEEEVSITLFSMALFSLETNTAVIAFWRSWGEYRKLIAEIKRRSIDRICINMFRFMTEEKVVALNETLSSTEWNLRRMQMEVESTYYSIRSILKPAAEILERLADTDPVLGSYGRSFRARTEALKVQEESGFKEFVKQTKKDVETLKKDTEVLTKELTQGVKEAKENELRMTRNFVQVIGIFAAIIAFVVTMVPASIRLGGASIPIALAGLAIVTVGIILVLATIFGKREEEKSRRRLTWGLIAAGVLFVGWFVATIFLASAKPDLLKPPSEPSRVDTIYQSSVDTVQTIVIQSEE
ncbi:hypothetical protein GF359_01735 [candidate division WOR-3 bacterium]|uniref:Uncharacterized protein n=1 Tax=candidate division WOR-3 bacterium TaxID=2052148 RepID=A0A9D5QDC9_UNCW3|nr:hypothetical protein [candidate division WOR-3 bacterium]MBD3363915.1 hypothetical protein [candidate division WOR-3 bacterium]